MQQEGEKGSSVSVRASPKTSSVCLNWTLDLEKKYQEQIDELMLPTVLRRRKKEDNLKVNGITENRELAATSPLQCCWFMCTNCWWWSALLTVWRPVRKRRSVRYFQLNSNILIVLWKDKILPAVVYKAMSSTVKHYLPESMSQHFRTNWNTNCY